MIAHLHGKLISKTPTTSIVDCQGVGYEVLHTPFTAEALQAEVISLHIHTHVREDVFQLYAFVNPQEREVFRELLKVSSVGPKLALGILSGIHYDELVQALIENNITRLQKIPGIGRKTAERLSVELKDRLSKRGISSGGASSMASTTHKEDELESVLINLGYQKLEIAKAVKAAKAREESFSDFPLEQMVKQTLGELTLK